MPPLLRDVPHGHTTSGVALSGYAGRPARKTPSAQIAPTWPRTQARPGGQRGPYLAGGLSKASPRSVLGFSHLEETLWPSQPLQEPQQCPGMAGPEAPAGARCAVGLLTSSAGRFRGQSAHFDVLHGKLASVVGQNLSSLIHAPSSSGTTPRTSSHCSSLLFSSKVSSSVPWVALAANSSFGPFAQSHHFSPAFS